MGEVKRRTKLFNETSKTVGKRITLYLREVGITQLELATKCFPGVTVQMVNRRLNGAADLTVGDYMAICDYLNVPYDKFMVKPEV